MRVARGVLPYVAAAKHAIMGRGGTRDAGRHTREDHGEDATQEGTRLSPHGAATMRPGAPDRGDHRRRLYPLASRSSTAPPSRELAAPRVSTFARAYGVGTGIVHVDAQLPDGGAAVIAVKCAPIWAGLSR